MGCGGDSGRQHAQLLVVRTDLRRAVGEGEKDAAVVKGGTVVEKDVVVVEKDVAVVVVEEGTCSSKYPNPYSHHPCEYHRLCVREKRNLQLKESTKPLADIRLHRLGELYSPV
jgi:hypothetical protein